MEDLYFDKYCIYKVYFPQNNINVVLKKQNKLRKKTKIFQILIEEKNNLLQHQSQVRKSLKKPHSRKPENSIIIEN